MTGSLRTKVWMFLAASAALVTLSTASAHALPSALDHVDPNAPCFRWPAVDFDGDGVLDRVDFCNNTPKGCSVDGRGCPHDADGDGVCDELDQCPGTPKGTKVNKNGCPKGQAPAAPVAPAKPVPPPPAPTPPPPPAPKPTPTPAPTPPKPSSEVERQLVTGGKVRLENIYFETNKATLLPESETTLRQAGEALEKYPDLKVEVQGHTDTRGTAVANQRLSQSRAESVRKYLLDNFRLRPENVIAKGYGETQPETKERNQEELLRNRRVELKVLNPEVLPRNVQLEK